MPSISYLMKRISNMNFQSMFERIDLVNKKTNKSKLLIFLDMVWCGIRYGAGYVDYDVIGFYKLNSVQRKTMLTRGLNNKFVKMLNEKEYWHIFDSKHEFNQTFSRFVTRDWLYPVSEKKEETLNFLQKHSVIFAKPNAGQCGKGIEKINIDEWKVKDDTLESLYNHLKENKLELVALAIGGVAEMAEEDGLLGKLPPSGDLAKQIGERSIARRFEFIVGRLAGFGTGGERDDAGAGLTTVVLLLQEKRELGCAIDGAPRLEDEERHGTFMFDRIRHDLRMEL